MLQPEMIKNMNNASHSRVVPTSSCMKDTYKVGHQCVDSEHGSSVNLGLDTSSHSMDTDSDSLLTNYILTI